MLSSWRLNLPLKIDSHVSFHHPDINILKVAAKPARSRARPSCGVEQCELGRTTKKQSLLGEAHSSKGAPSARAWLFLAESRSWEPPVAARIAAMNGEAAHGQAELNLLSEPTLITGFHCALHLIVARRMAAGGPLMSFWIWWSWPDIQKCPLSTSSLHIKGKWAGTRTNARLRPNNGTCVFARQRSTLHTFIGGMIDDRTGQIYKGGRRGTCAVFPICMCRTYACARGWRGCRVKPGWMVGAASVCRHSRMRTSSVRRWWALMQNKESQSTRIHPLCQGDTF